MFCYKPLCLIKVLSFQLQEQQSAIRLVLEESWLDMLSIRLAQDGHGSDAHAGYATDHDVEIKDSSDFK